MSNYRIDTPFKFWLRFCSVRARPGFQSGWALLGWALAYFVTPPDYVGLAHHGPAVLWAVIPGLFGVAQVLIVFFGRPSLQHATSLIITGVWGTIEMFLFLAHCRVAMLFVIPTFALTNILAYVLAPPGPQEIPNDDADYHIMDHEAEGDSYAHSDHS